MARSTFKVLFYVKRQSEKSGQVPVMGRITINGTISQFSCKLSVSPKLWDTKANKASGKSVAAQRTTGEYQDQYRQAIPASLRPGFVCHGRKGQKRMVGIRGRIPVVDADFR